MNESATAGLVKNTFKNPYSRERFLILAKNIFKSFDESKSFHARGYVKDKFKKTTPVIKTYERFGTFTDNDNNKIDILAVYLEKDNSLDQARTAQRNFVADYLKQRDAKEAALVAFVPPTFGNWRLSLVKMDYSLAKSKAGKIKTIAELTPARRFSFSVGADENTHTAQKQLLPILQKDDHPPNLSDLEDAFSVEVVTKDFFEKYKTLFVNTKEALDKIITKDEKIKADFAEKHIDTVDFTKKLLGQIVFLYFLQKKGWFGVARDESWGTGPKDFLRRLFEKQLVGYDNFFNNILEPLFYEALAIERPDDFYSKFNCKIPFLNGGLFDPLANYDWIHTDIRLDDSLFSNETKTKEGDIGDGILDVFDRYNFTVKEDEPLEKEVAVDPEMLGKVFENLLDVKDRKSKGTYYTPREIVHYMCQESLINYLATETDGQVKRNDIETLIRLGEIAVEHEAQVVAHGKETDTYQFKLPKSVRKNAGLIDDSLEKIKTCDPAVGSGAFLVGMMTEIVRARNTLSSYLPKDSRSIYAFKRHAIQNSLYGVDIDPGAVEIAKLRLWLSLIVDEQDIKQIKPLPNLDYKIMQGNSLLEEYEGIKLFDENIFSASPFDDSKQIEQVKEKLNELQREFFKLHSAGDLEGGKKQQIEARLKKQNDLLKKLTKTKVAKSDNGSLFDQMSQAKKKADELKKLHQDFFETAHKNRKDEIKKKIEVLEWDLIETTLREQNKLSLLPEIEHFKKANIKPFFLWKLNFSEVFEKNGGFDVVIGNPPYVSAVQGSKENGNFRDVYRKRYGYLRGAFDLYVVFLLRGLELGNQGSSYSWIIPNKFLVSQYAEGALEYLKSEGLYKVIGVSTINIFENASVYPILIFGNKGSVSFSVYDVETLDDLREHILQKRKEINSYTYSIKDKNIRVASGTTGFQAKLIVKYITENKREGSIPFVVSGSIDPYLIDFNNIRYMNRTYSRAYIKKGKAIANSKWSFWLKPKIVIAGMTKKIEATYSDKPLALGVGIYGMYAFGSYDPKYLLGLLNSKFFTFYLFTKFKDKHLAGGYLAINKSTIEALPLVDAPVHSQNEIVNWVSKILSLNKKPVLGNQETQNKVDEYERQIDQLVYALYELTPEEVENIKRCGREND